MSRFGRYAVWGCVLTVAWAGAVQAAPEIARVMKSPDTDTLLIFGEGFRAGETEVLTGVEEVVWWPDADVAQVAAITESGQRLPHREPLPQTPPADARPCRILQMDSQVIVAVSAGGQVVWVRVGAETSDPAPVALPQLWWVFPDVAAPGQDIRVFGRALISNPYRPVSYGVLVPAAGGPPLPVPMGLGRHPFYERAVRIPADAQPGEYRLYVHNGAGGVYGWSEPLTVRIAPPAAWPPGVFDVRDFGARGDGMADDTGPLLRALAAAEQAGGGTVYLPPGKYVVHTHLQPAEWVHLRGAGQTLTVLTVSERYGFQGDHPRAGKDSGLVILAHRCGLSDVTVELRRPLAQAVFIRREPPYSVGEDVQVRRCTFRGGSPPWEPGQWRSNELPVVIDGPVVGLAITDCLFDGTPGGISGWGAVRQGDFSRNVFRSQPLWGTDMLSIRHLTECVVEDNVIDYAHRGLTFQDWSGWGSFYHNCIAGNAVREIAARRDNASETYLLEGGATHWRGFITTATAETLTVEGADWEPDAHRGRIALVIKGRGLGQYRWIASNDSSSLTLTRPWNVTPDSTSYVAIGECFAENLLLDNADLNGDAAVQFWGSCIGNVLAGHISRNAQGLWLWTYENADSYFPCAFNEVTNCRFLDRGAIWLTVDREAPATAPGPLVFGNLFTINQVVDFRERPGNQYWPYWHDPAYAPDTYAAVVLSDRTAAHPAHSTGTASARTGTDPGIAYNVFDGDQILRGAVAVRLSAGTYGNVFRRTRIDGVGQVMEDRGTGNLVVEPLGMRP